LCRGRLGGFRGYQGVSGGVQGVFLFQKRIKLSSVVSECKPLPTAAFTRGPVLSGYGTTARISGLVGTLPPGLRSKSSMMWSDTSAPISRGLHSFTLELNLSNSRTHS